MPEEESSSPIVESYKRSGLRRKSYQQRGKNVKLRNTCRCPTCARRAVAAAAVPTPAPAPCCTRAACAGDAPSSLPALAETCPGTSTLQERKLWTQIHTTVKKRWDSCLHGKV